MNTRTLQVQRLWTIVYWSLSALALGIIFVGQFVDWHTWPKGLRTYSFAIIVIIYLTKIIISLFLLIDDVVRLFRLMYAGIGVAFMKHDAADAFRISRLNFIVKT